MLASLARALRLSADERDYLFWVAGHSAPDPIASQDHVAPALLRVLDRLSDTPAMVLNQLGEVLIQNDLAKTLFGDTSGFSGMDRSSIHRWFMRPADERWHYPESDHERQSRSNVASLRAAYGAMGSDSRAGELVRDLIRRSPEFAALWDQQEVARLGIP